MFLVMALLSSLAVRTSPTVERSAPVSSRCPGPERARIVGRLHTCGGVIVDHHNRLIRLKGFTLWHMARDPGLVGAPGCWDWTMPPIDRFADVARWGFNSIQLEVSWANIEAQPPTVDASGHVVHHWNHEYLRALDQVIDAAKRHGLAVLLTMTQIRWSSAFRNLKLRHGHVQACGYGMPPWLYPKGGGLHAMVKAERRFFANRNRIQKGFVAVWRKLARRYRHESPVVGAFILHEAYDLLSGGYPGTSDLSPASLHLARFYEKVGDAIHRVNRHLLVMYSDHSDWRTGQFALTRKPHLSKAVYGVEFYARNWNPDGKTTLARYERRAKVWNKPLWIHEFNAFHIPYSNDAYPHWARSTRHLLEHARRHHLSWHYNCSPDLPSGRILRVLRSGL
jgi:hypothetical protein